MKVPLLDLKAQYRQVKPAVDAAVAEVLESQYFILGPVVQACEKAVAAYSGCAYGCGMSSGTDALLVCLMNEEIGAGDEVITSTYTFFATAGSIARVGARPVFVDIDPVTFNLRPDLVEAAITPRTRAIMPVHLYGRMADMDALMALADRHGLIVIEDACQAIGAASRGRPAGSIGHYGCFSFFPSKNLGGGGDGGMVVTQDADRAEQLQFMRNHGMNPKYYHHRIGGNFRLDALQAAIVNAKLPFLDGWTDGRRANARRYDALFTHAGLSAAPGEAPTESHPIGLPAWADGAEGDRHVVNQYILRATRRDALRAWLTARDIGTEIYYPVPLHQQACFAGLGYAPGAFPESERAAAETIALPVYAELTGDQAAYVVQAVQDFYKQA